MSRFGDGCTLPNRQSMNLSITAERWNGDIMSSLVGSKKNVKIFVLYLMENINYPLDFVTLNDIVMQTDYVIYLDFAEGFHEMLRDGLIEAVGKDPDGNELYTVTDKGRIVAGTLKSDILDSILDQSLAGALRYLDFRRRGIKIASSSERLPDGSFDVTFTMTEKDRTIMSVTLAVDSENRAERMRDNFRDRPEAVYRGMVALLAGNVNYLFD